MNRTATARRANGKINSFAFLALLLAVTGAMSLLFETYSASAPTSSAFPATRRLLVTGDIDESSLVTLAGNTRPEANAKNDRGPVPRDFPMAHLRLQLRRSAEQERALDRFIDQLHDPRSPNYHRWLTAQEFGRRYGLEQKDLARITRWLQSHGFKVDRVYPGGVLIDFSGTAGQVREGFQTEIHQLDVNGTRHIANLSDPRIPAALAPAVVGVVALHDFKPHAANRPRAGFTISSSTQPLVPADLATIYNFNPLFAAGYSGQGQTIAVIEDSDIYNTGDWATFRNRFGLGAAYAEGNLLQIHPGGCSDPGATQDDSEAIIDAEWASAAAPSATIEVASCTDLFTALANLLTDGTPPGIVSISYGESEPVLGATFNAFTSSLYQQGVAEGVSIFVAAGDWGAAASDAGSPSPDTATDGIAVNGLASTIYNVAIGGTDFGDTFASSNSSYWSSTNGTSGTSNYGSALSYIPEIPWNDSCAGELAAEYNEEVFGIGSDLTYGAESFCNSGLASYGIIAGGGGPSGCATGTPATGGVVSGSCAGYAKPDWQSGLLGNPDDGARDLPDVSLFASNGFWGHYYVVCDSDIANGGIVCSGTPDTWSGFGGTSFGAPVMAAIQSLRNQRTGGSQGNPNPLYYQLASIEYGASGDAGCNSALGNTIASSCIFNDVTQGDVDVPCTGGNNCYAWSPNTVSGFAVNSDGALALLPGSPFPTGGSGALYDVVLYPAVNRIVVSGGSLFASNPESGNVSGFTIDPGTGVLTPAVGSPFAAGPGGDLSLAATPNGLFLFAANSVSNSIYAFSIGSGGALTPVRGSPFLTVDIDGFASAPLDLSASNRYLAATLPSSDAVAVFSIGTRGALTPVTGTPFLAPLPTATDCPDCTGPAGVDINSASTLLFTGIPNLSDNIVLDVFNLASNGMLTATPDSPFAPGVPPSGSLSVGSDPNVVRLSPNSQLLFVSNQGSNTIASFAVANNGDLSLVSSEVFGSSSLSSVADGMDTDGLGRFLFEAPIFEAPIGSDVVEVFAIGGDGSLTPVTGSPFATGQSGFSGSLAVYPQSRGESTPAPASFVYTNDDFVQIGVLSTSNTAFQPAYETNTGWDFATGIGTVNAYNLVMAEPGEMPPTPTPTPTSPSTPTPTSTPTLTPTPTPTRTPMPTSSPTQSPTPTPTPTPTPSPTLTSTPTATPTSAPTPTPAPSPTPTPTSTPTPVIPLPTATPSPTASPTPTPTPTPTATATPTPTPTAIPAGGRLALSKRMLKFRTIRSGRHKTLSFTIENVGKGELRGEVDTSGIVAPLSVTAGAGGFALAHNKSRKVSNKFAPMGAGTFPGAVNIVTGDPKHLNVEVSITAQGR